MPQIIRDVAQPVTLHQKIDNLPLSLAQAGAVNQYVLIHICAQHIFIQREHNFSIHDTLLV